MQVAQATKARIKAKAAAKSIGQYTGADIKAMREKLGLNQSQFWGKIGVTQSGGSRYESGRNIPRPVRKLVWLVYESAMGSGDAVRSEPIMQKLESI